MLSTVLLAACLGLLSGQAHAASTICQAGAGPSWCSDGTPGGADAGGFHDLNWVNLNKSLSSIAVSDNQVWGIDASQSLWYLPNFKTGTVWRKVAVGVAQVSVTHNLICQINVNQHVYCSTGTNPTLRVADGGSSALNWFDTGLSNFSQIAVSAGRQFWGVDTGANLVQVKDYTHAAATSTYVASGVKQVAVDGRGQVCQINQNQSIYCSDWAAPATTTPYPPYYGLPWNQTSATNFSNIAMADGQLWGTDNTGRIWLLTDYANPSSWFPVALPGVGTQVAASSPPSSFGAGSFASDEVAVLMFMGQSNAVGVNSLPGRFMAPAASNNVWGVQNAGWNFLPGNTNGSTPFNGAISSIGSVSWVPWSVSTNGPDMNLGFNNDAGAGGNAANFAAFQWQGLINAGWVLPDLYIIHIGWPSQGVDPLDATDAQAAWVTHGVNLWQPALDPSQMPSFALAPFARTVMYRGLNAILASGKKPRVLGLQWNQWEAEAGNANPVVISDAPANYRQLVSRFNAAIGTPIQMQFTKPLSVAYSVPVLTQMQGVFSDLAATDPSHLSVIDVSQVSSSIFSGGALGGGDGAVHYNLDTHRWFANQSMNACLFGGNCGTRVTSLPATAPN
jgi:hypothetical protein